MDKLTIQQPGICIILLLTFIHQDGIHLVLLRSFQYRTLLSLV